MPSPGSVGEKFPMLITATSGPPYLPFQVQDPLGAIYGNASAISHQLILSWFHGASICGLRSTSVP
jgi:hypothetical protein